MDRHGRTFGIPCLYNAYRIVHGIPTIKEPAHQTLRHTAQRTTGVLKLPFIGADKVLPVEVCIEELEKLGIGYEIVTCSAHRQPKATVQYVEKAIERGALVFTAVPPRLVLAGKYPWPDGQ